MSGPEQRKIILFGKPGSGKGTQARILSSNLDIEYITTGRMIRREIDSQSPLGQEMLSYISQGELVPDHIMNDMVRRQLTRSFVLDGYPRTFTQAREFGQYANESNLVHLEVSDETSIERIAKRMLCPECDGVYGLGRAAYGDNQCYDCEDHPSLIERDDDTPGAVLKRLKDYTLEEKAILGYLECMNVRVHTVNGEQSVSKVFYDIKQALFH